MLLFKPEHVPLILSGRKTQTRRMWADDKPRAKVGSIHWAATGLFKPKYRFARLSILAVDWMPLDPMPAEDVYAEGYDSLEDFKAAFNRINKASHWMVDEMVWRVSFRVIRFPFEALQQRGSP